MVVCYVVLWDGSHFHSSWLLGIFSFIITRSQSDGRWVGGYRGEGEREGKGSGGTVHGIAHLVARFSYNASGMIQYELHVDDFQSSYLRNQSIKALLYRVHILPIYQLLHCNTYIMYVNTQPLVTRKQVSR